MNGCKTETMDDLLSIMRRLRAPDGCPWDREQTHKSLKKSLMEECAELMDAIEAFYSLKAGIASDGKSARLVFGNRAARANPEQSIERDSIDTNGPRYRVSPEITCGQIAALATCLHAARSDTVERTVKLAESFRDLLGGGIMTI